jgi:hypothetical protein
MANRWCDGLGRYGGTTALMLNGSSGQAWAQTDGHFALSNANPRTGSWHLRMSTGLSSLNVARRVFGAPLTEVFLGVAIFAHSLPTNETDSGQLNTSNRGICLFALRDQANSEQCTVWLGTDGAVVAYRGATLLGRSAPVIGAGAYQHLELYGKAGNGTAGALEVRVDEVTRLNLTGIDTVQSANVEFSQWAFGHGIDGGTAMVDFADFFCNDTVDDGSGCSSFIGDVKSGLLLVNANTAQADFALSAGVSGYALLGTAPPDDSTYVSTASTTAESDFGLQDGPANLSEILTVRPFMRAMKDDAGSCTIAPSMKSGGTKAVAAAQPITTAFAYYDSNVPVDPATGVPWVLAGLNAALHVTERTA